MSAPPPTSSRKSRKIRGLLLAAVLIGLACFLVPKFLSPELENRKALQDLKTFYLCILMYAHDHGGTYPSDLITVVNEQIPAGPSREAFHKKYFNSDDTPIPALRYYRPPATANAVTAPPSPDTLILAYDHDNYRITVAVDGSGKMETR